MGLILRLDSYNGVAQVVEAGREIETITLAGVFVLIASSRFQTHAD